MNYTKDLKILLQRRRNMITQFCLQIIVTDKTLDLIKNLIKKDNRVGLIKNVSNFGFVRSSANALLAPDADANIS